MLLFRLTIDQTCYRDESGRERLGPWLVRWVAGGKGIKLWLGRN